MADSKCDVILVAAGSSTRFGSAVPKQFEMVAGRPLYMWSLDAFMSWEHVGCVVVVLPEDWVEPVRESFAGIPTTVQLVCVAGGIRRQESVEKGLQVLEGSEQAWVMVHDAARPMIDTEFLEKIWKARLIEGSGYAPAGIIPGVPVNETVKMIKANGVGLLVEETLPRDHLRLIQTPQLFATETLREAHREFHGLDASDDSLLVEKLGLKVLVVEGLQTNIKVTYQEDRERVSRWLGERHPQI